MCTGKIIAGHTARHTVAERTGLCEDEPRASPRAIAHTYAPLPISMFHVANQRVRTEFHILMGIFKITTVTITMGNALRQGNLWDPGVHKKTLYYVAYYIVYTCVLMSCQCTARAPTRCTRILGPKRCASRWDRTTMFPSNSLIFKVSSFYIGVRRSRRGKGGR